MMKYIIKVFIITAFVVIISWQVLSIAAKQPLDYDKYVKNVERIESKLLSASFSEAKLLLMSGDAEDRKQANILLNQMIEEYEELKNNSKQRQHALEEIVVLTYKTGNYEEALVKAVEVLAEYPKSKPASIVLWICYRRKAEIFIQQEEYDLAIAEYEKILEYPITTNFIAATNYLLGGLYERKGDIQSAISYYKYIIDNYPEMNLVKLAQKRKEKLK